MIVTLTANPSIDRTVTLAEPLLRGAVHRARSVATHPGGKGVNVSRVVAAAGVPTVAVLPGNVDDPLLRALTDAGIEHRSVPTSGSARINLTVAESDGTTTKINEPGYPLTGAALDALAAVLGELAVQAEWVVLSGSLPPAVPIDWYVELTRQLSGTRVAVDTSDAPLLALARGISSAAPQLIKPNTDELAQLTGSAAATLEDPLAAARAAAGLVDRGFGAVLATLGAAGAVLVTSDGAWHAAAPTIRPRSTVGAGDSALAGYLLADLAGAEPADRLRHAVAYGSAAAALPGTGLPGPQGGWRHYAPGARRRAAAVRPG
ncbi:1-phosphofructokinase family hexose kinase [Nocardia cyriacigeorgica]|uniref:1-phosphofructokinase family hexose kinase n=1 Tax=Nocardia cyriacigeorgica TaxID=135487 RepID=A0ABX0D126_9NOCA|nr:1-phosphofructokinase family hexose kinase [Nocardia cyriacigeorgica]NEW59504.1 1-phosphofructokinase family hexose kinase [Nocardia cyriacigeorgica]